MKSVTTKMKAIRFFQHVLAALIAFVIATSLAGSSIMIQGINGYYSYSLYDSDRKRTYEDSYSITF